jgi:hypothetical protein
VVIGLHAELGRIAMAKRESKILNCAACTKELGTLEFGDRVDFTIDGGLVGRIHFDEISIKDELVREIDAEFNLIVNDNPDALVEMFLVKHIRLRASA